MLIPENPAGLSVTQILTSALAFLVSIITAVLGWIVKGAGERMKRLEEQQERLAEKVEEDLQELSERRSQSESRLEIAHLSAIEKLSQRTQALEIKVAQSTVADENLTKSIDRLTNKVEKILENWPANKQSHRPY